jgi:hypothetical protein
MMLRRIAAVALGAGLLAGCAYSAPPSVVYGYALCAPPAAGETPPAAFRPPVQPPPGAAPPPPIESGANNQCVVPLPSYSYPASPSPSH